MFFSSLWNYEDLQNIEYQNGEGPTRSLDMIARSFYHREILGHSSNCFANASLV